MYGIYRAPQILETKVAEMIVENMTKKRAKDKMYDYLFNAHEKGGLGISHRSIIKIFTIKKD